MKNSLIYIPIISLLILMSGCTKSLDLYPLSSVSDATFWKEATQYKLAANSLYYSLSLSDFKEDVETELSFFVPNEVSNGTLVTSETSSLWTNAYVYIRDCNKIISMAEKMNLLNDTETLRFVSEAKFFRAWNYWMLFRLYGGVPIIKDVLDVDSKDLYVPRSTREETVSFILQDLAEAEKNLPLKSKLSSGDVGRITKGAAEALRARIALFEGTWSKYRGGSGATEYFNIAIESAKSVISSSEYSLFEGKGAESYRYLFIEDGDDSPECVLDDRYEVNMRDQNYPSDVLGGYLCPTKKLADMYLCTDGLPIKASRLFKGYETFTSEFQNRDPRMAMTIVVPGSSYVWKLFPEPVKSYPFYPCRNANTGYMTNKYRSEKVYGNTTTSEHFGYDIHTIRYAEVLLIYAEAVYERDGTISDEDLNKSINVLRARIGVQMPPLTNNFVTMNNLDMRDEIRRERTVELALEGFRYDDLRRWKTAEKEMPEAIRGVKIVGTEWGTTPIIINGANVNLYQGSGYQAKADGEGFLIAELASARSFDPEKHYLRPLPTKEININNKLKQNPGW